ncbi:MAG: DUF1385 domain-containing protein [Candidatus Aquicultor sp.]
MAKTYYGGQAVIEGVMMKGPKYWSLAVRTPEDEITTITERSESIGERWPILKKPLFRGIVVLIETLILGVKTIALSANLSLGGAEEEITPKEMVATLGLALVLVIGLFMVVPFYLTRSAHQLIDNRILFALVEGVFRISIFVIYIAVVSKIKDIQRVFQYHGAEHKTIHAFEAGEELTPANAAKYTTLHIRCGTSFMLIVMVVAILAFSFLPTTNVLTRIAGKIILIPLVAGISYEVTRIAAKYSTNWMMRILMWPGMALQRLTTKEPDESQLEVAIKALKDVLAAEGVEGFVKEEPVPEDAGQPQVEAETSPALIELESS